VSQSNFIVNAGRSGGRTTLSRVSTAKRFSPIERYRTFLFTGISSWAEQYLAFNDGAQTLRLEVAADYLDTPSATHWLRRVIYQTHQNRSATWLLIGERLAQSGRDNASCYAFFVQEQISFSNPPLQSLPEEKGDDRRKFPQSVRRKDLRRPAGKLPCRDRAICL
jgi:hypothetical protein